MALAVAEGTEASVYLSNIDGRNMTTVSKTPLAAHPTFSPTGKPEGGGGALRWTSQTVDESPTAIAAAMGLDGSGYAHIVYSENPVLYATNASGSWSSESLEPEAGAHSPSLAVSKDGVVHVAFVQDGEIWHLHNEDGVWTAESIAAGEVPSIAVDGSGSVHISFTSEDGAYYATNSSGEWATRDVLPRYFSGDYVSGYSQTFPEPTSITIGANSQPRIVYNEHRYNVDSTWTGCHLYRAGYATDGWASYDVSFLGQGAVRKTNDIVADPDGLLHASYGAEDNDLYGATHAYRLGYSSPVPQPCSARVLDELDTPQPPDQRDRGCCSARFADEPEIARPHPERSRGYLAATRARQP